MVSVLEYSPLVLISYIRKYIYIYIYIYIYKIYIIINNTILGAIIICVLLLNVSVIAYKNNARLIIIYIYILSLY